MIIFEYNFPFKLKKSNYILMDYIKKALDDLLNDPQYGDRRGISISFAEDFVARIGRDVSQDPDSYREGIHLLGDHCPLAHCATSLRALLSKQGCGIDVGEGVSNNGGGVVIDVDMAYLEFVKRYVGEKENSRNQGAS